MAFLALTFRRALHGAMPVGAVVVLNFLLDHLAPGDPAEVIAGEMGGTTAEMMAEVRPAYGLDRPLAEQLVNYLDKVASGDLGFSYDFNMPVTGLILDRLWATVLLVMTALVLAIVVGTGLSVTAAALFSLWIGPKSQLTDPPPMSPMGHHGTYMSHKRTRDSASHCMEPEKARGHRGLPATPAVTFLSPDVPWRVSGNSPENRQSPRKFINLQPPGRWKLGLVHNGLRQSLCF